MALLAKEVGPQLSEEELRSTKKVRIRLEELSDGLGEGSKGTDTEMSEPGLIVGDSYHNKLLNGARTGGVNQKQSEVNLTKEDYKVDREGDIPCIEFSSTIRALLAKGMERSLIIKFLGRSITYHDLVYRTQMLWKLKGSYHLVDMEGGFYCATFDLEEDYYKVLTGGPWMVYGAYLTIQPWSLEFDSKTAVVSKVVAWVRIPGLSIRYYHKSTLRAIGALIGEVVKVDYMTETKGRGRYARLAVLIDLLNPLIPCIKVDGKSYCIEYEGLPHICFTCGKHGHSKERCAVNMEPTGEARPQGNDLSTDLPLIGSQGSERGIQSIDGEVAAESSPYGSWTVAKYSKKGKKQYRGKVADFGGSEVMGGSRFNILFKSEDMPPLIMQAGMEESAINADQNERQFSKLPSNKGKATVMQNSLGASNRAKIQPHKVKSGPPKPVQVYRPKSTVVAPIVAINDKNQIACRDSSMNLDTAGGSGVSPTVDPSPVGKLSHHVAPMVNKKPDLVLTDTSIIPIKSSTTLAEDSHTVMILKQNRQALDDISSLTIVSRPILIPSEVGTGDVWPGKENDVGDVLPKRQGSHGTTCGYESSASSRYGRRRNCTNVHGYS
ncbi:hypothetical protein K1719_012004 [Acacia pycnantha]|nr:hypothetical protein K1719_012004 [Acacia pycnantha]